MNPCVAVVDIGSNSIKLLVARRGGSERIETLFTETIETRISKGISKEHPLLLPESISAGTKTIEELVRLANEFSPQAIELVATSAVRDAGNGNELIKAVRAAVGLDIRILSGEEEASYIGRGVASDPALTGTDTFLQTDLGGGSLELIQFEKGEIQSAVSLQLGAVRLSERFIEDKEAPINQATEANIRAHVTQSLENSSAVISSAEGPLVATGGAFVITRAILAAEAGTALEKSSPILSKHDIVDLKERLLAMTLHERLSVAHLPASRADIVPTALITIEALLDLSGREKIIHSFYNLRYGIASELLEKL